MTTRELQSLLEKIATWPEDAQTEALDMLKAIEREIKAPYQLTEADRASIERGLDDARHGRFVSDQHIEALFARYRGQ